MQSIAKQILEEAHALPEGALINAKAFLRLGSRAAVGQALRRLTEGTDAGRSWPLRPPGSSSTSACQPVLYAQTPRKNSRMI
jgi:hypothetical protein